MPQHETRQVAQQDLGRLVVELLALGGIRLVARRRQDRVEIGVAVLAVVLAAVAGREREDVAVRVRAPAPEGEVGLKSPLRPAASIVAFSCVWIVIVIPASASMAWITSAASCRSRSGGTIKVKARFGCPDSRRSWRARRRGVSPGVSRCSTGSSG